MPKELAGNPREWGQKAGLVASPVTKRALRLAPHAGQGLRLLATAVFRVLGIILWLRSAKITPPPQPGCGSEHKHVAYFTRLQ